jgi:hypothetical protein
MFITLTGSEAYMMVSKARIRNGDNYLFVVVHPVSFA